MYFGIVPAIFHYSISVKTVEDDKPTNTNTNLRNKYCFWVATWW